jgi:hypothetical protein
VIRCPFTARRCGCVSGSVVHRHCVNEAFRTGLYSLRKAANGGHKVNRKGPVAASSGGRSG